MRATSAAAWLAVILTSSALPAIAQDYPARPVRLIVPYPPGGGNDTLARIFGQKLSERWGQQIVIDNKPGAGGAVGTEFVARAAPDGYTVLYGTQGTLAANLALYPALRYDPAKDFVPVHGMLLSPLVLVAEAAKPWKTVQEGVDAAQAGAIVAIAAGRYML